MEMEGEAMISQDQVTIITDMPDATNIPRVHPVLIVLLGSTEAELGLVLHVEVQSDREAIVPNRCILSDSMPYENVVNRLVQNGWSKELLRSHSRSHF